MLDKRISLDDAVERVESGSLLALGGMTNYRRPIGFVRALIKHFLQTGQPNDLTLLSFTAGLESDLLVGAGMVSRVRTCYFGLEIFGLAPMFTYYANRGEVDIIEETEASLAFGLRAQMAGVGFMPGRGWLSTDLPKLRPDVKTIIDPYNGEELIAFPAIKPDLAVLHVLEADQDGNARLGRNKGVDEELMATAVDVILTAEQITTELSRAELVSPFVNGVVNVPNGAAPTSCHPNYALDGEMFLSYTERVSDPASYQRFLETWL
jgi:glutaconate CoA-transferase, subunit A